MELFEIKNLKEQLIEKLDILKDYLKIDDKKQRLQEIEKKFEDETIWNDKDLVKNLSKEKSVITSSLKTFDLSIEQKEEVETFFEIYTDSKNEDDLKELEISILKFKETVNEIEFKRMLSGQVDFNNAIVSINAGSGGTESQDWASMLSRMIVMYAENHKYKVSEIDFQPGEEAGKTGIKSVTYLVEGEYAYGLLKSENGVHRLVRISPFDANARRHTSFASISVTPEIDDDIVIEIKDEDIRIDTYRASGAGGQHVNKTDSAIRITHFPSGIVVTCQNERSQYKNKDFAFKVLRSRLYEYELQKKREKEAVFTANKKEITWGSQIRSYVLHPYKMVKDHRTDVETGNTAAVLDGEIDVFVKAYLLEFGDLS